MARALKLPGHSPEAAELATDKVAMRRRLKAAGVSSPAFAEVGPEDNAAAAAGQVPGPWVVKPVDSMGARGVVLIDRTEDLENALAEARRHSRSGRALLETYIDGPEFSLDALVEDGRLIPCGIADRLIRYPPYFIEIGHTIPSACSPELIDRIWAVFAEGVKALGLTRGAAKGDVKLGADGPVIGEIAARLSGGYMSGWTWPAASGVEPTRGGLRLAVGLDAGDNVPKQSLVCAERALVSIDGTLRRLDGRTKALSGPGIEEVFLRYAPGDRVSFPRNNVEKAGNVIAVGPDGRVAEERAQKALCALNLELDPNDPRTGTYLDQNASFPPDALPINPGSDYSGVLADLWRRFPPRPSRGQVPPDPEVMILPGGPRDTAGRDARKICRILASEGRCRLRDFSPDGDSLQFQSDFWKALVRGGVAGARWFLEQ